MRRGTLQRAQSGGVAHADTLAREMNADAANGERPRIQSVARALAILLDVAREDGGLTVREIADRQGLRLPTTYHLVHTLSARASWCAARAGACASDCTPRRWAAASTGSRCRSRRSARSCAASPTRPARRSTSPRWRDGGAELLAIVERPPRDHRLRRPPRPRAARPRPRLRQGPAGAPPGGGPRRRTWPRTRWSAAPRARSSTGPTSSASCRRSAARATRPTSRSTSSASAASPRRSRRAAPPFIVALSAPEGALPRELRGLPRRGARRRPPADRLTARARPAAAPIGRLRDANRTLEPLSARALPRVEQGDPIAWRGGLQPIPATVAGVARQILPHDRRISAAPIRL